MTQPKSIADRRQLFVDDALIDRIGDDVRLHLHRPVPREVAAVYDAQWEGCTSMSATIFKDAETYRMYYRASGRRRDDWKNPRVGYAQSTDGIHWHKPSLGLVEFAGSKTNNLILGSDPRLGTSAFTPFKDTNPDCPSHARYKAIAERGSAALYGYVSSDAIHWHPVNKGDPTLVPDGKIHVGQRHFFDSQNLVFWDALRKTYVMFFREWDGQQRMIRTVTSDDFERWQYDRSERLSYANTDVYGDGFQLYTNAVLPYERAPQIYIGFPTRLMKDESTEPYLMASRNGRRFYFWGKEPVIPRTAPKDRQGNRGNYMQWGIVRTGDKEVSVYASEGYEDAGQSRLRRFTYRVDGFASVRAGTQGGELVTKPITFDGGQLVLNFVTREGGSLRVEVQDERGTPLDGFGLVACRLLKGDEIDCVVAWKSGSDVKRLAGQTIRLRFEMKDTDLYSFRFRNVNEGSPNQPDAGDGE